MLPTKTYVAIALLGTALMLSNPAVHAQPSASDRNARALRGYMLPYSPTKLEWELMQFNLLWSGSYSPPGSYLTSYPVFFDYKAMRFRTLMNIVERREYQDPEPWSQLSRIKRESVLQGAVDQVRELLTQNFPEIKAKPELLLIEFRYRQSGGGFVNAAKYESGSLSLVE